MLGLSLFSCTKEGNTIYEDNVERDSLPVVYFVYRQGTMGDQGYVDAIYNGTVKGTNQGKMKLSINELPTDGTQAVTKFQSILNLINKEEKYRKKLVVIANDNFEQVLHQCEADIKKAEGVDVLLAETNDTTLPVYTFRIPQYGIYYQASKVLVSDLPHTDSILIVNANPTDWAIKEMRDGFSQAITDYKEENPSANTKLDNIYMSETTGGYNMPDSAYRLSYKLKASGYQYVLPLCGETAQGFLRYTREHTTEFSVLGVDYDMQNYTYGMVLSVVKHIDTAMEQWIKKWGENTPQERHQSYGLASGYSEIVSTALYDYIPEKAKKYYQVSLEKENEYENKKNK